ncbi:MAG TPA: bifunctional DNA-formamidopyrimidine glycosylase/DNA-(apurinic or apyrimidinic site) lyase [Acidobacteriaceae bacterium]|jgi:formamidopyrimidine-DNA glycosylase|nr:bifunctional DNA-formamidopyrimidine glycosylase/DNA-(apurinic or apyrimidinic site) lyase [Acidobacteriaceae bacterium]
MPELPEVETVARGVDRRIRGDRIASVWLSGKKEPFKSPPGAMAEALLGKSIARVYRVGKHIVFDLVSAEAPSVQKGSSAPRASSSQRASKKASSIHSIQSLQWIVHLGMTGRLLVSTPEVPAPPHTHAILSLASGRELRFVDPRRFGRLALHPVSATGAGFTGSGREPLALSAAEFAALFSKTRSSIKAALLNQKLLQGVGNIYADESLFRAGIRPRRMAARLSSQEMARLHRSLQQVLKEAIALGGSSISDYVDAEGAKGFFQLKHRVYQRAKQPCVVCGTPIRRLVIAGRSTHFCPDCQH